MTKLEKLLIWMDDAEYAPTYGELREKVVGLMIEEQGESVDLANVIKSLPTDDEIKEIIISRDYPRKRDRKGWSYATYEIAIYKQIIGAKKLRDYLKAGNVL